MGKGLTVIMAPCGGFRVAEQIYWLSFASMDVFEPLLDFFSSTVHISASKHHLPHLLAAPRGKMRSYQDGHFHDGRGLIFFFFE